MNTEHRYWVKLIATILILIGTFFNIEHLWNFGHLQYELFGHETYGAICWVLGGGLGWYLWKTKELSE